MSLWRRTAGSRTAAPCRWLISLLLLLAWSGQSQPARAEIEAWEEEAIKNAVSQVAPSVIRIETFGGLQRVGRMLVGTGPTTGIVVSEDGYIISSAFNFVQKPSSILVTLPDGTRTPAEIVARDNSRMLVLLKVSADQPLRVPLAVPRQHMQVGQWAIAVGKTFSKDTPNMSVGILSALNRIWGKAIQTDAKISPSNYGGPLIDIQGRVLGVLVPLSPQGTGELAGAEWYDSGIGFAVPLDEINRQLDKLKQGDDLAAGILGVSLKQGDDFATRAIIAAIPPKSPAAESDLRPDDEIVEVDGAPIVRQTQLKHALGPRYAGEEVRLVLRRGDQRIEKTVQLTDKLIPYAHPFLGILPQRGDKADRGILVRYVYANSPAAEAGLQVGDRLQKLADKEIVDPAGLREMLAAYEPEQKAVWTVRRGDKSLQVETPLAALPTSVPQNLPSAFERSEATDEPFQPVGELEIKIPEETNSCLAYVPKTYNPQQQHGLLVWFHAPGAFNRQRLVERWKEHCEQRGLILLAPQSADPRRWQRLETEFIRKAIDDVMTNYRIDPSRVVLHGHQAGGSMAYLFTIERRQLVRGTAVVDAALPRGTQPLTNDPVQRLAIYTTRCKDSRLAEAIQRGVENLEEAKFPVTVKDLGGEKSRYLGAEEIAELVRWIDSLDRI